MGFLDRLKAMLGISAAKVTIVPQSPRFRAGEPITGQVTLCAGRSQQEVAALTIAVIKRITTAVNPEAGAVQTGFDRAGTVPGPETTVEDGGQDTLEAQEDAEEAAADEVTVAEATLAENISLGRGYREAFAFSLEIGEGAEPSTDAVTWVLFARADILAAVDATAWERIELTGGG